ncbi:hypothetical protein L1279_002491 [Planomicrobium sp. HSC-17F08]|nr:hypothetical protein [Planomicrobium sp. HSC-17F08]
MGSFLTNWMPTILGVLTIIIAKKSLDYDKRVLLVKESYEPILSNLKFNKSIAIRSTQMFDFEYLTYLKSSYLFDALESKDKRLINRIIKNINEINLLKKSAFPKAEKAIIEILNKRKKLDKGENVIGRLRIFDGKFFSQDSSYFYTALLTSSLAQTIESRNIYIDLGSWWFPTNEYDTCFFKEKESKELKDYLYKKEGIEVLTNEEDGVVTISDEFSELESDIITLFENETDFKNIIYKNNILKRDIESLEKIIKKRIQGLLIPNFFIKNVINKILNAWNWFYNKL